MRELTRVREEVGWTQRRLAEESGINQATISQIETGRRSPNVETLQTLAAAMGREIGDFFPKAQGPLPLPDFVEQGQGADERLAEKLHQQLDTQLRALRERQGIARSDEDLHEAAKDFQHWWLFSFDWLSAFLRMHPEYRGPRLKEAVERAGRAVGEEFPQGAVNPREAPDMAAILQEWTAHQDANA